MNMHKNIYTGFASWKASIHEHVTLICPAEIFIHLIKSFEYESLFIFTLGQSNKKHDERRQAFQDRVRFE